MFVKRFFEPKLAQASYMIGCVVKRECIVIDPNRDAEQYSKAAEAEGVRIAHITETHIHADYLSGSRELAARTKATLYVSDEGDANWKYAFAGEPGVTLDQGRRSHHGRQRPHRRRAHAGSHAGAPDVPRDRRRGGRRTDRGGDGRLHLRRRRRPARSARARREHQGHDGGGREDAVCEPPEVRRRSRTGCRSGRGTAPDRRAARASARSRTARSATSGDSTGRFSMRTRPTS